MLLRRSFTDLNLNSLLVKHQIDNPSPGAVTGGNWSLAQSPQFRCHQSAGLIVNVTVYRCNRAHLIEITFGTSQYKFLYLPVLDNVRFWFKDNLLYRTYTEGTLELIRPLRRRTNSILIAELRFEVVLAIQITILIWNSFLSILDRL